MTTTKVNSEFIAVNAISGTIIADGAITSTHLAANSVDSSELVTGSIDTIHIAANQITATKIVTNGVLTRHISDDQITADKLANSINTDIAAKAPLASPQFTNRIGIGVAAHATAALNITTTDQHIRLNNGSEIAAISVLSGGELDLWGHGDGETINFRTGTGSGTVAMNIVGTNVGIGATTVDNLLHIEGPASSHTALQIETITSGYDPTIHFKSPTNSSGIYVDDNDTNKMKFYNGNGKGAAGKEITFDNNGNVGIGTTSPTTKLHVESSTVNQNTALVKNTAGTGVNYGLEISAGTNATDHALQVLNAAGTSMLRVAGNGNVGIGTSSPASKLHVTSGIEGISAGIAGSTYGIRFDNGGTFSSNMSTIHGVDDTLTGSYQPIMLNGLDVRFGTSGTERMRISQTGSITSSTGGMTLQTKEVYGNTTVTTSGADVTVISTTITILANSKIAVWFQSGQIQNSGGASNPNFLIKHTIGSTTVNISDHLSNHWDYNTGKTSDARIFMTGLGISGSLSAGTYTVAVIGNVYNGTATFNYQGLGSTLIIQEISA
tara:strand:+ start:910 stop:2565 length:1656 start_codon:yes stop_codon:yes gene_type:complete